MGNCITLLFYVLTCSHILNLSLLCTATDEDRKVYIVYMGSLPEGAYSPSSHHISLLQEVIESSSIGKYLIRSYKRSFNGFAAKLTSQEAQKLASKNEVVSVFPSKRFQLQTTRSWEFLGLDLNASRRSSAESNIVVGVIDSGIWPESESFNDEGFDDPPAKWKGACSGGSNFTCNNKIIGARFYVSDSARDDVGHGTHTASTAAGNAVEGVSFPGRVTGTAKGGVPSARIAAYKVCSSESCSDTGILAGFDDAIADGVDVITISIGTERPNELVNDPVAIGSFHAQEKGILTLQSAGNSGDLGSGAVSSVAPWQLSVAATNIDIIRNSKLVSKTLKSQAINDSAAAVVASFSSRGPNAIIPDINKPDISAPGVDILAAFSEDTPYNVLSGTSMSCPHVAGVAAYIKTFHPNWSPSAVKSAILTTALPLNPEENPEAEFAYGSGHVNPLKAINPGLVYEVSTNDYINLLCSLYDAAIVGQISGDNSSCSKGKVLPKDLNYPSLTFRAPPQESFTTTFRRTVKNVGPAKSSYTAKILADSSLEIQVEPKVLSFNSQNEKKSFNVTVSSEGIPASSSILSSSLVWSDGSTTVRSPIIVYPHTVGN